jgi:hypothetical protein
MSATSPSSSSPAPPSPQLPYEYFYEDAVLLPQSDHSYLPRALQIQVAVEQHIDDFRPPMDFPDYATWRAEVAADEWVLKLVSLLVRRPLSPHTFHCY